MSIKTILFDIIFKSFSCALQSLYTRHNIFFLPLSPTHSSSSIIIISLMMRILFATQRLLPLQQHPNSNDDTFSFSYFFFASIFEVMSHCFCKRHVFHIFPPNKPKIKMALEKWASFYYVFFFSFLLIIKDSIAICTSNKKSQLN